MRRVIAAMGASILGVSCLGLTATPASAKTYTACVKKSNGKTVLLTGKKKTCKKGWKKVTWTKAAPTGDPGAPGTAGPSNSFGDVYDGSGARVGQATGYAIIGLFGLLTVRAQDGDWTYLSNGWLYTLGTVVIYDNASCSGSPFLVADDATEAGWFQGDRATARYVERATAPLGPAKAYKQTGTSADVAALPTWYRGSDGSCTAGANATGVRIDLVQVPAPPDRPGPLTIRAV